MDEHHRTTYMPINEAILGAVGEFSDLTRGRVPAWYGYVLAELAVVAPAPDIVFVDGTATGSTAEHQAHFEVYTSTGLRISIDGSRTNGVEAHALTVRSRAGLRTVSVAADVSALGTDWPGGAPGHLTVDLGYADGEVLRIPAATYTNTYRTDALVAFLPSLLADLGGGDRG